MRAYLRITRALLAWHKVLLALSLAGMLILHAARAFVPPPARFPWLHDRAFITYSFAHFALAFLYLQLQQWACWIEPLKMKIQ